MALALVGDAAHAIHPLAGQGVNLGLRDVAALADVLQAATGAGSDIGSANVLAQYQRRRRLDVLSMIAVTDGLSRIFSTSHGVLAHARGIGLQCVERIPPLKRFFMRDAMGITGDVPSLMRTLSCDQEGGANV